MHNLIILKIVKINTTNNKVIYFYGCNVLYFVNFWCLNLFQRRARFVSSKLNLCRSSVLSNEEDGLFSSSLIKILPLYVQMYFHLRCFFTLLTSPKSFFLNEVSNSETNTSASDDRLRFGRSLAFFLASFRLFKQNLSLTLRLS